MRPLPQRDTPPPLYMRAYAWARANLFPNWWNALLTVLFVWLIYEVLSAFLGWAVFDAVWGAVEPEVCKANESGACWAVIHEKYRLILFGRYPFDEQWRPLLAMALFIGMILLSCHPRSWRSGLGLVWTANLALCGGLMYGGFFGMEYVDTEQWGGLPLTLLLAIVGCVVAFPLAVLLALGRRSEMPVIKAVCVAFIELVRGVPLITILFMASLMIPMFLPSGVTIDKVLRALVGFTLFTAAYLAETVRGGLQGLPRGQYEAADALGLGYWRKMWLIVLPQALRKVIPPMVNTFIGAFKDTSLVLIISLTDLLLAARAAFADPLWRPFFIEVYVFVALIYFCFCFFMSKYSQWLERDLAKGERR